MRAVFLTAGAAGMYCGSCMHDNALAKELRKQGVDCLLQPMYTPVRTDSPSIASERLFFGGIHIYLLQQMPWLHWIPSPIRRMLDWKPLIRLATRRAHATDPSELGELAVSMLQGIEGRQADEVERLVDWLANDIKPHAIVFSNLLIGGALPEIRKRLPETRLVVLLQGDDIFLDHLLPDSKSKAIDLCRRLIADVDYCVVNSRFYADKMGVMLHIPKDRLVVTPLSIDIEPFRNLPDRSSSSGNDSFRLGYLARIAPEKGLHRLVDTFIQLASHPDHPNLSLDVAGWLGESNNDYLSAQQRKVDEAGLGDRYTYHGSPDLDQKIRFLQSLDLLCVPTDYEDPKGLFVLEAIAAGVPVVQPDHGAFSEMIAATGGGVLVQPDSVDALCEAIGDLKRDDAKRLTMGSQGRATVHANHSVVTAAKEMRRILFDATFSR